MGDDDSSVRDCIRIRGVRVVVHFKNLEIRSIRGFALPSRYSRADSRIESIRRGIGYNHERVRHLTPYPHTNPAVCDRPRHMEIEVAIRHSIEREDIL